MEIVNDVVIEASPEEVFALISDVDRVVSCLPGAELIGQESDDSYRGRVKVRVGPIGAAFEGVMTFLSVDSEAKTMHMVGRGADKKGNGSAEADIRLSVTPDDGGSRLEVVADLNIKGKFVQFGKGAISAVSSKIMAQFARNVQSAIAGDTGGMQSESTVGAPAGSEESPHAGRTGGVDHTDVDHTDVGSGTVGAVLSAGRSSSLPGLAMVFLAGCVEGWILTRAFGKEHRHA